MSAVEEQARPQDALRRTRLANERTQLAWWRTGLTAIAVGIGIGRVIPELGDGLTEWPYLALGIGFALYGVGLFWYGRVRERAVEQALAQGRYASTNELVNTGFALAGVGLGLATAILILVG